MGVYNLIIVITNAGSILADHGRTRADVRFAPVIEPYFDVGRIRRAIDLCRGCQSRRE
jgi:hypothetical protein